MKFSAVLPIPALLSISFTAITVTALAQSPATPPPSVTSAAYGKLPLSFEANQGQADSSVQFLTHGQGYSLFLRQGEAVLALQNLNAPSKSLHAQPSSFGQPSGQNSLVSLRLVGSDPNASASREDLQITRTNYFLGANPAQWHTDIPNYGRVRYHSVYPGVDLVYYGNQSRLEHDFVVAPNADPGKIALSVEGMKTLVIDHSSGDLILKTSSGDIRLLKPVSYQESEGRRTEIPSAYKLLAHHRVGFSLGSYNHAQPLIIDPILVYSTYLGGSGLTSLGDIDQGNGVVVDPDGNAYIVGSTQSADFPVTSGVYQSTNRGLANYPYRNAFISKINATGTQLIFSTYLGSTDNGQQNDYYSGDQGVAIALDSDRNVYVTGYTTSTDFPTTPGAFQTVNYNQLPGGSRGATAFVAKLSASGTQLDYSTFLGGHAPVNSYLGDKAVALAVDSNKNTYVAGTTSSPDFPVSAGAFQTSTASQTAAFITKLNPAGTGLVYSTFLGSPAGSTKAGQVAAAGLALDGLGNAYVTGTTTAYDFPVTAGAFQVTNHANPNNNGSGIGNPFVTKLDSSGSALVYSTYLGGSGEAVTASYYVGDTAQAIAVDTNGSAYIAGTAFSFNFPLQGGLMQPWNSNGSGFLAKFNPSGTALDYSTRIGGAFSSVAGLAVDSTGEAYLLGSANPLYFAITPDGSLLQKTSQSQPNGIFLTKVNTAGNALEYATLFGGTGQDTPTSIAVDTAGDTFLTGNTFSTDFSVTSGALQTVNKGTANHSANAFVSELTLAAETNDHALTQLALSVSAPSINQGMPVTITATTTSAAAKAATGNIILTAAPSSPTPFSATSVALDASGVATLTTSTLAPGNYTLYATYAGDNAHLSANSIVQTNGTVSFQVTGAPAKIVWTQAFGGPVGYGESSSGWGVAARVTDSLGNPAAGIQVSFAGNPITFSPATEVTDANGTAGTIVMLPKAGSFLMYARANGVQTPAIFKVVVTPAPLTVTLLNRSRTYGAANPSFSYTLQGLIGSDTVTVTPQTTATPSSLPGTYPVSATVSGPLATNYTVTVNDGILTIVKAPLYISANNVAITYGQTPALPTAYTLHGFVNGDTASVVSGAPVLSTTVTSTTPVGFYPIKVQVGTLAAANYYFDPFSNGGGSVGVYKAPLTIRPASFTIHVGDPLPTFTYTLTGFVNGDTQASATTGAPSLTTTAPSTAKPGRFFIIGNRGTLAAHNYNFANPSPASDGILTILP